MPALLVLMSDSTSTVSPITVSIVSFNTRELLRTCLQALLKSNVAPQIIVADNASRDGSASMVGAEFPGVEVVSTGANLGYGPANNLAFERAKGRYFCALNSDAFVETGALKTLMQWMDAHPEAGACVPQLCWPDGAPQESAGDDPGLLALFWQQTLLEDVAAFLKKRARRFARRSDSLEMDKEPREVEQLNGACLFCRSEAYAQIGGFDPSYWMYGEDVDLSVRLRAGGWKLFLVPAARVTHHLGASSRDWRGRARMVFHYNRSRVLYFGHRRGPRAALIAKSLTLFGALLRLTIWSLAPGQRERVRLFRQVLRQTWRT